MPAPALFTFLLHDHSPRLLPPAPQSPETAAARLHITHDIFPEAPLSATIISLPQAEMAPRPPAILARMALISAVGAILHLLRTQRSLYDETKIRRRREAVLAMFWHDRRVH